MESECRFTVPPVPGGRTQIYFSWGQYYDSMIDPQKKTHQNASLDKRTFRFLIQDIMPQIRRENHSCMISTSFKSFIHYVLNSYSTGGYVLLSDRKRPLPKKLFYKAFSYFPLSKIKQEDSWRWWQSHIDYSCFSTSWCSLPFPSLFPKSFWPASSPSLHKFHIQRQEQHG